jgi:MFS family permease
VADWHLWVPPALTKPRFRKYVAGHSISVIGGWIQQVALAWLIYRLTGSMFLLGLAGFLLNIFYLLLGPLAGLAADRLPRLRALIAIDLILAALSAMLAAMGLLGVTNVAVYLLLATLIGITNAFEMPMRQSLFKEIVEERALMMSAIAVSSMVFNVGRMVGPAVAGVLLVYVTESWCFLLNAIAYGAIIAALLAMRLPAAPRPARAAPVEEGMVASSASLLSFPGVRYLLPTVVAIGLFGTPYVPLMPSVVAHFFDGRSATVGLLMSAAGLGALASAAYLSLQPRYSRQLRLITTAPIAAGLALCCFAWSRSLPLSLVALASMAAAILLAVNATNAMLQQSVPEEWRGRVIAIYGMSFAGRAPLGGLVSGWLAEHTGLTTTLTLNGGLIVVAGLLGRWRLHHHPEALRGIMRALVRP